MAKIDEVLKKKSGMKTDDKKEESVGKAITQDPKKATIVINAEHIIALGHMTVANQMALQEIAKVLIPLLQQHGQIAKAVGALIPEHQAIINHLASNAATRQQSQIPNQNPNPNPTPVPNQNPNPNQ